MAVHLLYASGHEGKKQRLSCVFVLRIKINASFEIKNGGRNEKNAMLNMRIFFFVGHEKLNFCDV